VTCKRDFSLRRRASASGRPGGLTHTGSKNVDVAGMIQRARVAPRSLTPHGLAQLQRTIGNHALGSFVAKATLQRVNANRVEYQHNRKVETDNKGRVTKLNAPIDISFGTDEHSTYFARERSEAQLTGLRTVRWEMNDDWWDAAYYHAYLGKKPKGAALTWLAKIEKSGGQRMAASDGRSLTTDTKKKAPHFDANWEDILNAALVKGTGRVEDTESEMREIKKERAEKEEAKRTKRAKEHATEAGVSLMGVAWFADDPTELFSGMTEADARAAGMEWKPE